MAAPVTLGKLCDNTSSMEVGDYIPCVYECFAQNQAGYFSQLGVAAPTYTRVTTTTTNGGTPVVTTEEVEYSELSTTPAQTCRGFFYLLKADYGLLIADRMVQSYISWESLNKLNYIYGGVFDVANAKTKEEVNITITTATTADGDSAKSTTETDNQLGDRNKRYYKTTSTVVTLDSTANTTTTTVTETIIHCAYIENESVPDSSTTETDADKIIGKITGPTTMFY